MWNKRISARIPSVNRKGKGIRMIEIDGSPGEGGQMLSSSVTLALLTGQPVHLTNMRARRPKPNLQPQHLAAVRAAAAISGAEVQGACTFEVLETSKLSSAHLRRLGLNAELETKRGSCHPSSLGVFVVHYACSQEAINKGNL
jgi:hypothetical protein